MLIDTGQSPKDSHVVMAAVKKLTSQPVRYIKQGKSLDEIKKELTIPGTEDWQGKDRFPNNIEAAYRAVTGK